MFLVYLKVVRIFKPGCAPALLELDDNFGTSNWTKLTSIFFVGRACLQESVKTLIISETCMDFHWIFRFGVNNT